MISLCDFFVISRKVYEKKSVICPSVIYTSSKNQFHRVHPLCSADAVPKVEAGVPIRGLLNLRRKLRLVSIKSQGVAKCRKVSQSVAEFWFCNTLRRMETAVLKCCDTLRSVSQR